MFARLTRRGKTGVRGLSDELALCTKASIPLDERKSRNPLPAVGFVAYKQLDQATSISYNVKPFIKAIN